MRFVSIIGDSISTYAGFNPAGYAVFYDSQMQINNNLNSVYDTWWAKVNQALCACICVNNSYSGSKVTGYDFPAASSELRTGALHTTEYVPDLILMYVGFNDFGNGVPIHDKGLHKYFKKDLRFFADAYSKMVSDVKRNYPNATIVCATLMRTYMAGNDQWIFPEHYAGVEFEKYNQVIRRICKKEHCVLADIGGMGMYYETLDGTHPTAKGHNILSQAWIHSLSQVGVL